METQIPDRHTQDPIPQNPTNTQQFVIPITLPVIALQNRRKSSTTEKTDKKKRKRREKGTGEGVPESVKA